ELVDEKGAVAGLELLADLAVLPRELARGDQEPVEADEPAPGAPPLIRVHEGREQFHGMPHERLALGRAFAADPPRGLPALLLLLAPVGGPLGLGELQRGQ